MKKHIVISALLFVAVAAVIVIYALRMTMVGDPLADAGQLVLVVARTDHSQTATMQWFDRTSDGWKFVRSAPVVLGENGLGWGIGLHKRNTGLNDSPVKKEGDKRSPSGAFPLLHSYGYVPPSHMNISFPYTQSTETLICVDEPSSKHYNRVIDISRERLDPGNLPSHETLLRPDDLYRYVVLVGHNTWRPKPGAGSCIFLHIWRGRNLPTSGCTAMSESSILQLLSWLDAGQNPVLVQLSRADYMRLRETWGLPEITI